MSIRVRLVLSYIAMLVVPLILAGIALMIFLIALLGDLKSVYQIDFKHRNPIEEVMKQEAAVSADIKLIGSTEPDSLLKPEVANKIEEQLQPIRMELIIRKNQDIVYVSEKMNKPALLQELPAYGSASKKELKEREHGYWLIVEQYDVRFTDGSPGSVFIVTDMNFLGKFLRNYTSLFFLSLLLIFILTNGMLTYWVSRSIIRPLRMLKRAAEKIKEGQLDFEIRPMARDEIGTLSIAFEEMRRKLKESVEVQLQYEENRKELLSNISHDLKTPVTAIKGYVEGIIDGVTNSPEKLDKYVRTIYTKAVQMDRLIDELFLFSKLDLRKVPFHFERVELNSYLQDCIDELHMDIEKRGVTLEREAPQEGGPLWVMADRNQLRRVLVNIIENAVKYMDKEHGHIRLHIRPMSDRVILEVEDNGKGIDAEALPHIFDRFYRADPSRNASTGGSGLGLAIAKQIIEEHGGTIWAESEPGKGTSILFTLKKIEPA